jgi:hypothetical protein
MGIKKCRIWCWFRIVEKVSRKFTQRKLEGWELLYTVLKDEKVHKFYTFMLITFLYEFFYTFCNDFEISIQFCVFWYPYQNVLNKIFVGSYYHFLPTLNPNAHKTTQKTKTFFFSNVNQNKLQYVFQFWFLTNKVLKSFHPKIPHAKS